MLYGQNTIFNIPTAADKFGITFLNVLKLGVIFKNRKRGKNSESYY